MAKDEREFLHESLQDVRSIVTYLEAIREGFTSGTLNLRDETGEISLHPRGLIRLQIDSSRKRDRVKLSLRLAWKEEDGEPVEESNSLVIEGSNSKE